MGNDQEYQSGTTVEVVLAVSLELAAKKWKVALHDGQRERPAVHTVEQPQAAARLQAVLALIDAHRDRWSLPANVRIVVSYEAGQDAFWICPSWSRLDRVTQCRLKVGVEIVIGPGQSAQCGVNDNNISDPPSPESQVFIPNDGADADKTGVTDCLAEIAWP